MSIGRPVLRGAALAAGLAALLACQTACQMEDASQMEEASETSSTVEEAEIAREVAAPAPAEDSEGARLYREKTCIACHGSDAKTPILPDYPKIAGQTSAYALQQMKDIKSGARDNGNTAAMRGVMHLVNEDEMQVIAEHLASLQR